MPADAAALVSTGSADEEAPEFYSYWVVGLGPYGAIYLCHRLCILVLIVAIAIGVTLHRKRRQRRIDIA